MLHSRVSWWQRVDGPLIWIDLSDVYMTFFLPETVAGKYRYWYRSTYCIGCCEKCGDSSQSVVCCRYCTVHTKIGGNGKRKRQKLMFRVKAKIDPTLLNKYIEQVKTGLPGVAYIKIDDQAAWPTFLEKTG